MAPVAASWAVSGNARRRQKIISEARGMGVPSVVGMRLGRVSPARITGSERVWETRFLCSTKEGEVAVIGGVLFGTSPGVGILLYCEPCGRAMFSGSHTRATMVCRAYEDYGSGL